MNQVRNLGELILLKDAQVQIYTEIPTQNKKGNKHYKEELMET